MLQGRAPIIYGDGEQRRCFSYITDCVDVLAAMATSDLVVGEIINIGPDEEFISVNELAAKLANVTGCNLSPIHMPDRPREVKLATCSADKARKLLGYETKVFLDDGLCQLVDWIKESGPRPFEYHFDIEIRSDLTPRTWTDRLI
jgi:UDP-glucose 4-epimerase